MSPDQRHHKAAAHDRSPAQLSRARVTLHTTPGPLQPRLTIGPVDDPYEREAERVADQVMRMPAPAIQRATAQIQRAAEGAAPEVTPEIEGQIGALHSGGQQLDGEVRRFMEPRFGYDFGSVRVHTSPQAARAASSVNALAFTLGNDVVFGAGQYQPGSAAGRRLIAHELTHVVQQGENNSRLPKEIVQRQPITLEEITIVGIPANPKLPPFATLRANYIPDGEQAKRVIGGQVDAPDIVNTCVVRLSRALNYSNHRVSRRSGLAVRRGGDNLWYALRVREMRNYLNHKYGKPSIVSKLRHSATIPDNFIDRQGIICFDVDIWNDATGHVTLWDGQNCVDGSNHWSHSRKVELWIAP